VGSREGPLLAAEQLAFDEVGRQGGTVHRDHGPVLPAAHAVDGVGHHPLSRTRLAEDEDGRVRGGHLPDPEQDIIQSVAAAHDLLETQPLTQLLAQVDVLFFQLQLQSLDLLELFPEPGLHLLALVTSMETPIRRSAVPMPGKAVREHKSSG
jgi:hypothetical protein